MINFEKLTKSPLVLLTALSAVLLLALDIWSVRRMAASNDSLEMAVDDFVVSQRMAKEIQQLKFRPKIAALEVKTASGINELVKNALLASGLGNDAITQEQAIDLPTADGKNSNYKERETNLKFDTISMRQLVLFCQHLEDPSSGLTVRDLDLKAVLGGSSNQEELWEATVTLTQLIFSPTS
ncbi:MAG: hypothetical protein SGI77_27530 [Pirellulaceae bacterium]|nr:hypothetical protein [Pirellulaceae bacterium]